MTKEEEEAENVDSQEEIDFGHEKQKMRAKILEVDQAYLAADNKRTARHRILADEGPAILPRIRPSKHESDMDSTRSTPPPNRPLARRTPMGGVGRRGASTRFHMVEGSSPAGSGHVDGVAPRKPRPPTAHQLAVERHRKEQVDHILDRGVRKEHRKSRKQRRKEGGVYRAIIRVRAMSDELAFCDSDEEGEMLASTGKDKSPFRSRGPGGLCQLKTEPDDFGEETSTYSAAIRRAVRRLDRWDAKGQKGVVAPIRRKRPKAEEEDGLQHDEEQGDMNGTQELASELNGHGGEDGDGDGDGEGEGETPVPKKRKISPEPDANGDAREGEQENGEHDDGASEIVAKVGPDDDAEEPQKGPSPAEEASDAE